MEIAYDLATGGAAKVWPSARTPPNIVLRTGPGGLPGDLVAVTLLHLPVRLADAFARAGRRMDLGDLSEYGLPVPDEGVFARLRRTGAVPAIVDREVIDAIKDGRIEVVRGVEALDRTAVRLADGRSLEPDALVAATGYRRGLEPLVGHPGVLDARGMPRAAGPHPALRGLRFVGYTSRPGALGYMSKEAKRAARAIARELGLSLAPAGLRHDADVGARRLPAVRVGLLASSSDTDPAMITSSPRCQLTGVATLRVAVSWQRVDHAQHLVEVVSGGHWIYEDQLDLLVGPDHEHVADGLVVRRRALGRVARGVARQPRRASTPRSRRRRSSGSSARAPGSPRCHAPSARGSPPGRPRGR